VSANKLTDIRWKKYDFRSDCPWLQTNILLYLIGLILNIILTTHIHLKVSEENLTATALPLQRRLKSTSVVKKPVDMEKHSTTAFIGLIANIHTSVTTLPAKIVIAGFVPDALLYVRISRRRNVPSF